MVLFTNINVNQRVEVLYGGEIVRGKVKYKGPLNGIPGDWVGVELNSPIGKHDGMLNGRRYFFTRPHQGIFTTADKIRFVTMQRNSFDSYRPVTRQSDVDEHLFTSYSQRTIDQERDPRDSMAWIRESYLDRATRDFRDRESPEPRYHLNHSVSNHIPAQTMLRPQTSKARFIHSHSPSPYYYDSLVLDDRDFDSFTSSPSIPKTHMPRETLARQVEDGWDNSHYVREMSIHTGRDSIKYAQWNNIS